MQISCYNDPRILEIGVDEVGRGPLFGRVYAAAVIMPSVVSPREAINMSLIKDSKLFHSEKKIRQSADYIREKAVAYAVCWRDEATVDRVNILQATQEAMHEAITEAREKAATTFDTEFRLIVDGNYFRPFPGVPHECFEKGDGRFASIAAASILAKVARDEYIADLCAQRPDLVEKYDLLKNKGYGTARHREGIRKHGYTDGHRLSFRLKELTPVDPNIIPV